MMLRLIHRNWRSFSTSARSLGAGAGVLQGDTIRIGCSSGFWGDTAIAAPQLVHHGNIDFLVSDYLSEITMSLLTAARQKKPDLGYTPDFVQSMKPLLKKVKERGIKVVTNAGGVNPEACAQALSTIAAEQGVELSIALVEGDNLMGNFEEVKSLGVTDIDTGRPLPAAVHSMNAYLGAFPIARALDLGADVVITGRCVDSALTLAPLIHKFGWKDTDFNLLASGSLAGHLVECGAQATGGIFTDWDKVKHWENIGFPIVECSGDGNFVVTKPENTGGLVSWATVAEQLVYEIGDPKSYILPDVVCDFSNVQLKELSSGDEGRVMVTGAVGTPPTDQFKVSATYLDGFRATSVCSIVGPRAAEKAEKTADGILKRTRGMFKSLGLPDYDQTCLHVIGSEASYGAHRRDVSPREVMMWLAVRSQSKKALEVFSRELAQAGTGMAPGFTNMAGGRPRVSPVLRLFSFLYPKSKLPVKILLNGEEVETTPSTTPTAAQSKSTKSSNVENDEKSGSMRSGSNRYRLEQLAYTRSGDKGNTANIGVIARHPGYVPYLRAALTSEIVAEYFSHLIEGNTPLERYELAGVGAFNFVLKNSLGGGGVSSIRLDPQGKAYGQMLADIELENLPSLEEMEKTT